MPITVSSPEIANYDTGRTMPKPSQTIPNHPKPSQTMHASPNQSQTRSQTTPNHTTPKQSQTIPNNSYYPQTIPNDPVHFQATQSTVEPCAPVNLCTTTSVASVRHVPEGEIAPSSLVEMRLSTAKLCSIVASTVPCCRQHAYPNTVDPGRDVNGVGLPAAVVHLAEFFAGVAQGFALWGFSCRAPDHLL